MTQVSDKKYDKQLCWNNEIKSQNYETKNLNDHRKTIISLKRKYFITVFIIIIILIFYYCVL